MNLIWLPKIKTINLTVKLNKSSEQLDKSSEKFKINLI